MKKDIEIKRAKYIQKNCELIQEFGFSHPTSKCYVNQIYNCSFTGYQLWDLFSDSSESIEKTFNVSICPMFDLPRETHRYLIEPLSDTRHIKVVLLKQYLQFRNQVFQSNKTTLISLFKICQSDSSSTTGSNMRNIMLLCEKTSIHDLVPSDIDSLMFENIQENEEWRVSLIKELVDIKHNNELLPGFSSEEVEDIMKFACVT